MIENLDHETLTFTPAGGALDAAAIERQAAALPCAFRDADRPTVFVVAVSDAVRDKLAADRKQYPEEGFPYTLLIEVTPERVEVGPPYEDKLLPIWRGFVCWLMGQGGWHVLNDFGTDLTPDVAALCSEPA